MHERSLQSVPWPLYALLIAALGAQIAWAGLRLRPQIETRALPAPPPLALLRVAALGEPGVFARLLMLWLQAYDNQPGVSLPLRALDYAQVEAWLTRMLELDPGFQYPLLAASHLYAEVDAPDQQRRMIAFIARAFRADPLKRWPWMAHAVYLAKHRLHDPDYALALARELGAVDDHGVIPHWAKQMHIFLLEDLGELESMKVLLGGLLDSGEISDPHERWFLSQRLHELEQRLAPAAPR